MTNEQRLKGYYKISSYGEGLRSYTPEYSTGIMDKCQRMRHGRERGVVNMSIWLTLSKTAGPKHAVWRCRRQEVLELQ